MTLLPDHVVDRLEHDESGRRITTVKAVDTRTGERKEFTARLFFLCASISISCSLLWRYLLWIWVLLRSSSVCVTRLVSDSSVDWSGRAWCCGSIVQFYFILRL